MNLNGAKNGSNHTQMKELLYGLVEIPKLSGTSVDLLGTIDNLQAFVGCPLPNMHI